MKKITIPVKLDPAQSIGKNKQKTNAVKMAWVAGGSRLALQIAGRVDNAAPQRARFVPPVQIPYLITFSGNQFVITIL